MMRWPRPASRPVVSVSSTIWRMGVNVLMRVHARVKAARAAIHVRQLRGRSSRKKHRSSKLLGLLAGGAIHDLVLDVTRMPAHPAPAYPMPCRGRCQPLPQILVLDRLPVGGAPAVGAPARQPLLDALAQVLRIGAELHLAGPGQCFQRGDRREQLHAIVRGCFLAALQQLFVRAETQQRGPAARTGVAEASPVGEDLHGTHALVLCAPGAHGTCSRALRVRLAWSRRTTPWLSRLRAFNTYTAPTASALQRGRPCMPLARGQGAPQRHCARTIKPFARRVPCKRPGVPPCNDCSPLRLLRSSHGRHSEIEWNSSANSSPCEASTRADSATNGWAGAPAPSRWRISTRLKLPSENGKASTSARSGPESRRPPSESLITVQRPMPGTCGIGPSVASSSRASEPVTPSSNDAHSAAVSAIRVASAGWAFCVENDSCINSCNRMIQPVRDFAEVGTSKSRR